MMPLCQFQKMQSYNTTAHRFISLLISGEMRDEIQARSPKRGFKLLSAEVHRFRWRLTGPLLCVKILNLIQALSSAAISD